MRALLFASPLVLAAAPSAQAAAPWSGQVGVSSAYMSKGISKTDGDLQVWGRAEANADGFYGGIWASNLNIPQRSDAEVQLYVGRRGAVAGYDLDVSAFYKTFPGTRAGVDRHMVEFRGDVGRTVGPVQARLRAEWTPDNFGAAKEALWVEGRLAWSPWRGDELSAAVGRRNQKGGADYTAWNVGVKHTLTPHLSADLRWYDTDSHGLGKPYHGRGVVGLTASF